MTKQVPIDTQILPAGDPGAIERALEFLRRGEPVAFPTDTVYGVGAHAFDPGAVARLFAVKERPLDLAIPLLIPDAEAMVGVCDDIPLAAWRLARRFWPGAVTLILRRSSLVPDIVTAGGKTVAVRVPGHPLVRDICRRLGVPLAATSANLHGRPDPLMAAAAYIYLGGRIPLILDGGTIPGGVPSTLLDLTTVPPVVRRRGPITPDQLAEVLGEAVY